jgi:hypothetical protein
MAGMVCLGAKAALAEPQSDSQVRPPIPGDHDAHIRLGDLRTERIRGNEKGNASEFAGKWKMRLPAGFEYTVELKQTDEGLLRMTCTGHALNLLGEFACRKNELLLVSTHHSAVDDYIWTYKDGKFVLTKDDQGHGATYLGAVLTRVP